MDGVVLVDKTQLQNKMENKGEIMKKRFIAILLTVALVISYLPGDIPFFSATSVRAETSGDYTYKVLSDGTVQIAGYTGTATEVEIPETIDGKTVTSIGDRAFDRNSTITSVIIPDSVKSIGDYAFCICSNLTSIIIPEGVTSIGKSVFLSCSNLLSVTIPDSMTSIGQEAFADCRKIKSVTIPGNEGILDEWGAFNACTSLESVTILDGVTSIGEASFANCDSLKNVTVPDSVTVIGADAFALAWINNLPEGMTYLGKVAFRYNGTIPGDTSITLKEGTTYIAYQAFYMSTNVVEVIIPDSVTGIDQYAFSYCENLTSIKIPDSITVINPYTFYYCKNLTSIKIPDNVTSIGDFAFAGCYDLSDIIIPSSVTSIGEYAFSSCRNLSDITIPDSVISIGQRAFGSCTYLTSITFPEAVTSIGKYAYDNAKGVLYCYAGTAAETYAKTITNGMKVCYLIDKYPTTLATTSYTYDGTAKRPEVTVDGLTKGKNYKVSYANNTNPGTATVTIKGIVNYGGTITKTFTINPSSIKDFSATLSTSSYTYDGTAKTPGVTVKNGENTLTLGTDYTVSHANNTNAGTATVTITGIGNYAGSITKNFTISVKSISDLTATLSTTSYTYDGIAKTPDITVKNGENTLTLGTDYTVSYINNTNPGTATVTITGIGNYTGTITKTFTISTKSISDLTATLSTTTYTYNGKAKKPSVTLKHGAKVLVLNKDYTVTYVANTNPGTATVILKGKGNYTGTLKKTYTIKMGTPKLSLTAGKKKVAIKWGKVTGASGYEVFMSTSKSGKYKGIKSANQNTYTFTKTGLTKGKTYYFRVRTYKKVNGKKVYSAYSTIKAIKVK